ncbi:MAG TPA: DNA repair protein RecN [Gemmatimonadaceae bacterium]|nr:DNA repair protein RecN [Gemmatimonadaceae bacterium]
MLTELRIKNFAIIEGLVLPLSPGFNVLSGETGAGKSIIVGALGMLLGERANSDMIRTGADRATVEGTFEIGADAALANLLDERGIEVEDGLVVLKREVAATGRGRAWINGSSVTAAVLADVGRLLVNLHGQHEAQTLLDADSQRRILDAFAGASDESAEVREAFESLSLIRRTIADLSKRRGDAEKRADYLRHVTKEVEDARVVAGEDERLEDEARRLEHADELRQLTETATAAVNGDEESVIDRLAAVGRTLASIQKIDPSLDRLSELYDAAFYNVEELGRELDLYLGTIELDPTRLEAVRRRRDLLFLLTKKYGPTLADVIATGEKARAELDLAESGGLDIGVLEKKRADAENRLGVAAGKLTKLRREGARRLAAAVDEVLPELGMPDGHLDVELQPVEEITATGAETIVFKVSLNLGHEARPLARVASGGELSRVMLALKTILARLDGVPTLVFDEVDAGIGGRVGLQVGETMRRVASSHQVFAISHLPQIAARAHHHIVVSKSPRGGVTTADVAVVEGDARVVEIARMLGGDPESDVSRAHARELIDHAEPAKSAQRRVRR